LVIDQNATYPYCYQWSNPSRIFGNNSSSCLLYVWSYWAKWSPLVHIKQRLCRLKLLLWSVWVP
ncbi:MAG: hypothetical protein LBJ70_05650, partial [Holosporales bacterium]|nr:hypothetical protein [Holosporales bacterium]